MQDFIKINKDDNVAVALQWNLCRATRWMLY